MKDKIKIKGAREHNLKNVHLELPRGKMIVFTGPSGSGKSSLAFDTIFAEGQRRYIESLSAYARQFLGRLDKPDVDDIEGLSPAISIDQKSHSSNPRSTVATITEIYDYLRVLFARIGTPYCPECGKEIRKMTREQIVDVAIQFSDKHRMKDGDHFVPRAKRDDNFITVFAPVVRGRKGEYYQMLYDFLNAGFSEVRIDGNVYSLRERIQLSRYNAHTIELVIDRIPLTLDFADKENRLRISEAVESGIKYGNDVVTIAAASDEITLSTKFSCPEDGFAFPEIEPRLFSFNSPYGACSECHGIGTEHLWSDEPCKMCEGKRLKKESLSVLINNIHIARVTQFSVDEAYQFFDTVESTLLEHNDTRLGVADVPLREIKNRLRFLQNVGLEYLTLERKAGTLSGGEAQRIRLASQIGSQLTGTLYVLDEPTIGLHQRDNAKLIATLHKLRDLGNTIIVVEHDEDTIRASDYLVDFGIGAGVHGGSVMAEGELSDLLKHKKTQSLTLDYLRGVKTIAVPGKRRTIKSKRGWIDESLKIRGAHIHNLKNVDVDIPLRKLTCVTGVSGSGKSTLIYDVLHRYVSDTFNGVFRPRLGARPKKFEWCDTVLGLEYVNRVLTIDQSPIGRTPRSNPATYVGAWTHIRDLFTSTEDARVRGYKPGRFSFNVRGGRCEHCEGHGVIAIEMHFLPTVYVPCDVCKGKRFDRETLEVEYRQKNIYEVLQMTVEEALMFFEDIPWLDAKLRILNEVGLGYLTLGQSATTLSGGEAQRIKLAAELGKHDTHRTLYLLDEPTTGLHFSDIEKLLDVLQRLVDRGNTVVVIEHNLDVIKTADWIIDLGPEGGDRGGKIVATGTPEEIVRNALSITGRYLKDVLKKIA